MNKLTILPGYDKNGIKEQFDSISFSLGELCAIVGPTGAGKSRFIKDIEMLVSGDSVTRRVVLLDGEIARGDEREALCDSLIAHIGQNMRFTLDMSVKEFLDFHREANGKESVNISEIVSFAVELSGEPFTTDSSLFSLSGGQARALMSADIACLSDRPIVLIDEIENAGIDKEAALSLFIDKGKLVFLVTHDPHTALIAKERIVISDGAVKSIRKRTEREEAVFEELDKEYRRRLEIQRKMREGEEIAW